MSSFAVTVERLVVLPHPNADLLELAQVGGYRAVVRKGQYKSGELAVYIPEAALLPAGLVDELGLAGRLAGSAGNRVKAVRLRGELSQGIVCSPAGAAGLDLVAAEAERRDLAELLGVTKWVPEVPTAFGGVLEAAPHLVPYTEIENIKRFPRLLEPGEAVEATEKLHGTCSIYCYAEGRLWVSSKGYATRRLAIVADETNLYWRAARAHGVAEAAAELCATHGWSSLTLYAETYGAGVQDLGYGATKGAYGLAVFDARVGEGDGAGRWLEQAELRAALEGRLACVPVLYAGAYDPEAMAGLAEGTEAVSGRGLHLREGVVVRPVPERYSPVTGGRTIAKFVSPAYLLRKGGTELE